MSTTRQVIEGTWEEIAQYAESLAGQRLRVEVLEPEAAAPPVNGPRPAPHNLAERLGDYVGAVKGTGEALSERTGERFGDYLLQKQREGRL
jgi:hypothetical protein